MFDPTPLLWALQDLNKWFYVGYRGGRLPHLAGWSELKQTFWNPNNQPRVYGFGFMGFNWIALAIRYGVRFLRNAAWILLPKKLTKVRTADFRTFVAKRFGDEACL